MPEASHRALIVDSLHWARSVPTRAPPPPPRSPPPATAARPPPGLIGVHVPSTGREWTPNERYLSVDAAATVGSYVSTTRTVTGVVGLARTEVVEYTGDCGCGRAAAEEHAAARRATEYEITQAGMRRGRASAAAAATRSLVECESLSINAVTRRAGHRHF